MLISNYRLLISLSLCILLSSCRPAPREAPTQTSPTPAWTQELKKGDWSVYTHGSIAKQVRYKGASLYTYYCGNVDYKAMYGSDRVIEYENRVHILDSSDLANRMPETDDRHVGNPAPFTDINGDGFPEIIFFEDLFICNAYNWYKITVVTLKPDAVTVTGEICAQGEIRYFADYDRDGSAEFVTTDQEGDFVFDKNGMPLSPYVYRYDKTTHKYLPTATAPISVTLNKIASALTDAMLSEWSAELATWEDTNAITQLSEIEITDDYVKSLYAEYRLTLVTPPSPDAGDYKLPGGAADLQKTQALARKLLNLSMAMPDEAFERYGALIGGMRDVLFLDFKHIPLAIKHDRSRDVFWAMLHKQWDGMVQDEYVRLFGPDKADK